MSTWTSLDVDDVDDDFHMSDNSSVLTAMSDTEEDVPLPPPLHQTACELLTTVLPQIKAMVGCKEMPTELWDTLGQIKDRVGSFETKNRTVAAVGRSGVGKSTLICALLKSSFLPSSALECVIYNCCHASWVHMFVEWLPFRGCTATITEISYHQSPDLKAVIKFVTRDEWKNVLLLLKGDLSVCTADDPDVSEASPASRARARFIEVYPQLCNEALDSWTVDRLLNENPVRELLGSERQITEEDPREFQRKLLACVTSCGTRSDQPTLWPLVSTVQIFGRFEVLRNGVTLVDLPGHGDTNNERNQLAEEYLKRADCILLVTEIKRAKNDRETMNYLRKLLTQVSVDGRTRDASVALVVTGSDCQIGDNECPLTEAEDEEVRKYVTDMKTIQIRLKETNNTGTTLEKKLRSSVHTQAARGKIELHLKKLRRKVEVDRIKYIEVNRANNVLLARARSTYVRTKLQETYNQIQQELAHGSATSLPIFCVGSRDYLGCLRLQTNPPLVFRQESESGIPELQDYVAGLGEKENLTDARLALRDTQDFLSQIKALFLPSEEHDPGVQCYQNKAADLMASLDMRAQTLSKDAICDIRLELSMVATEVDREADKVKTSSADVFKVYGSKQSKTKWNSYRACMRRDGIWGPVDLNDRLTRNIFEGVMAKWNKAVNIIIPQRISRLVKDLAKDFDTTLGDIRSYAPDPLKANMEACGSLGIQSRLEDSCHKLHTGLLATQRKGSRAPKDVMQRNLSAHYQDVGRQTGLGLFEKMKDMNIQYMTDHADKLYEAVAKNIRDMFDDLASDMEAQMMGNLIKITNLVLSLLKPTGGQRKVGPERLHAMVGWAEKVHPQVKDLLDSVEARLVEIS